MATPDYTAGSVMDSAAALLNDVAKQKYTYAVQLPYLRIALKDLRELFELNNIPVTQKTSAVLTVGDGITSIGFATNPALPTDLVSIEKLWERESGIGNFVPMTLVNLLPKWDSAETISAFRIYVWQNNFIKILPSSRDNDIQIDYIAQLFNTIIDENTNIGVVNGESFLHFRTAALCAKYIDEDTNRSNDLNGEAGGALERGTGIEVKSQQGIITRHKPFRAGYKRRGYLR